MFFVFDATTGALFSSGSSVAPADVLAARGLEAVEVASPPEPWRWDAATRQPVAVPPPSNVPPEVTNFQARAVLMQQGLFDAVNAAVQAQGGVAWQAWEYANTLSRNGMLVNSVGAALGLTDEQIDAMFIAASQIEA